MQQKELWVFGYGSLVWNPGFEVEESVVSTLNGYSRSFCMRSIHHRGTENDPGLVLALDKKLDATCTGLALKAVSGQETQVLDYLRERELISSAYLEVEVPLSLVDGRSVMATAYVIDEAHDQYCGNLPLEEQAQIIAKAVGGRGPNSEYLWNTGAHLQKLGISDPEMDWLSNRVTEITQC